MYMWTYTNGAIAVSAFDTPTIVKDGVVMLDVASKQYQSAGDWVGVLFAVQAIGSVLWAIVIPMFKNRKFIYALSLILGAIGFISTYYIADQYMLFISYALIGCAWAAMLALPFTILTNSLSGKNMGTYLGLFNGTICLPQIVAAAVGGVCVSLLTPAGEIAAQDRMLVLAGILLLVGALSVFIIKETSAEKK
jgi:maltose/moltooligosaccharide transporter